MCTGSSRQAIFKSLINEVQVVFGTKLVVLATAPVNLQGFKFYSNYSCYLTYAISQDSRFFSFILKLLFLTFPLTLIYFFYVDMCTSFFPYAVKLDEDCHLITYFAGAITTLPSPLCLIRIIITVSHSFNIVMHHCVGRTTA